MNETPAAQLELPRVEAGKPLPIAGLSERHTPEAMRGIPAQWQRFAPYRRHPPADRPCDLWRRQRRRPRYSLPHRCRGFRAIAAAWRPQPDQHPGAAVCGVHAFR